MGQVSSGMPNLNLSGANSIRASIREWFSYKGQGNAYIVSGKWKEFHSHRVVILWAFIALCLHAAQGAGNALLYSAQWTLRTGQGSVQRSWWIPSFSCALGAPSYIPGRSSELNHWLCESSVTSADPRLSKMVSSLIFRVAGNHPNPRDHSLECTVSRTDFKYAQMPLCKIVNFWAVMSMSIYLCILEKSIIGCWGRKESCPCVWSCPCLSCSTGKKRSPLLIHVFIFSRKLYFWKKENIWIEISHFC